MRWASVEGTVKESARDLFSREPADLPQGQRDAGLWREPG